MNIEKQAIEEHIKQYHPLGVKTLFMLILKRSAAFFIFLPVLFICLFFLDYVPVDYVNTAVNAILLYLGFLVLFFLAALFIGWLEYFRYWILIDEKSLKIKKGLISTEEIGIPYKHIRDVKIDRNLIDQLFGMSDISITLSDFGDNDPMTKDSLIFLPSLEKGVAVEIRDHITKRSQVEQISIAGSQRTI